MQALARPFLSGDHYYILIRQILFRLWKGVVGEGSCWIMLSGKIVRQKSKEFFLCQCGSPQGPTEVQKVEMAVKGDYSRQFFARARAVHVKNSKIKSLKNSK